MDVKPTAQILYITYDGLTDPLGQSQIIPYLQGLSRYGYNFTILSFEKKNRFRKEEKNIRQLLDACHIKWEPLSFSKRPPLLSKLYDTLRMRYKAFSLNRKNHFDMVHCRSYLAADVGLAMKKKLGVKFFFDMRGFWADEKKDGGAWNQNNPIFKKVYKYYKQKETAFLSRADFIVLLTEVAKEEIKKWPSYNPAIPVSVIPCCADMDVFSLTSPNQKITGRKLLNLPDDGRLIISYLGSIGSWYMLDEMLIMFKRIKQSYSSALFLFVTHSNPSIILKKLPKYDLSSSDIFIVEADRKNVPLYIKASDINISFIKPVYSKLSSSPTKIGEVLSMGIPMIVNAGVGDVEQIISQSKGGITINQFSEDEYKRVVSAIPQLLAINPGDIRGNVKDIFDLQKGIATYLEAYCQLLN